MDFFFDANKYSSIFSKKAIKKPELADRWLASWRDMDMCVRHDLLYEATTNNQAEYGSLILTLKHILAKAEEINKITNEVTIHGDSQLVVYQLLGKYRVNEPDLKPFYLEAAQLIHVLNVEYKIIVRIHWVPREMNNLALNLIRKIGTPGPDWNDVPQATE